METHDEGGGSEMEMPEITVRLLWRCVVRFVLEAVASVSSFSCGGTACEHHGGANEELCSP